MTAVGIVSKGKSTVALLSDTGEVLKKPYDAPHIPAEATLISGKNACHRDPWGVK